MNVQIPVKWLQELLALCGPEDHELRERVIVSITAMDEQASMAVVLPEPDAYVNPSDLSMLARKEPAPKNKAWMFYTPHPAGYWWAGPDSAEAMRASIDRAAIAIAAAKGE